MTPPAGKPGARNTRGRQEQAAIRTSQRLLGAEMDNQTGDARGLRPPASLPPPLAHPPAPFTSNDCSRERNAGSSSTEPNVTQKVQIMSFDATTYPNSYEDPD